MSRCYEVNKKVKKLMKLLAKEPTWNPKEPDEFTNIPAPLFRRVMRWFKYLPMICHLPER
jgi:hypothetical protein